MYKITRDKSTNFELFINFARLEYRQYSFLFQFKYFHLFLSILGMEKEEKQKEDY